MITDACPCHGSTLDRLLRPAILACIAEEAQHGYQIGKRLKSLRIFKEVSPDLAGLYRCLHELEAQGLVTSEWDAPSKGKARRRFSITRDGRDCVRQWAGTLTDYVAGVEDLRHRLQVVSGKRKA
jgi:DNA-binding PadR family transcriptional regulator